MYNSNEPQPKNLLNDVENSANLAMLFINVWATSLEVFLHKGMGRRYLGWNAIGVFFLVPLYGVAWPGYDLRPLVLFLGAFLWMVFVTRVGMLGVGALDRHSYYNGFPRMMRTDGSIDEVRFKRINEPIVVLFLGGGLLTVNQPLGWYVIIGAICMFLQGHVSDQLSGIQAMDMNDAMIEQSYVVEQFRSKSRR